MSAPNDLSAVMAGPDPAIQPRPSRALTDQLGPRVKPGDDEVVGVERCFGSSQSRSHRPWIFGDLP